MGIAGNTHRHNRTGSDDGAMEHCLKGFPSFDPVRRSYRQEEEAPGLARELADKVDVLLFTGPVSYQLAKNQHQLDIPSLFVPLTGSGLYAVLFRLERKLDVSAITVDTLSRQMLVSTFRELGHMRTAYEGEPLPSWKELVEFHRGHYEAGRSCCAITAIRSVALQLAREGIPCEWIVPTEQDIIVPHRSYDPLRQGRLLRPGAGDGAGGHGPQRAPLPAGADGCGAGRYCRRREGRFPGRPRQKDRISFLSRLIR
ncbi:hypothetical protein WJ0W_000095 [Paenibacillus melissococcoides]|uniref:Uncharacterized protein n=1 Tax=Paenibacillus melissococcoides TaxID=2912268 RepID=A0ABN8TW01_9BACL|nr:MULTISPECIES: hypothetical protein [Paenibacillus]MEB9896663.1 hypothetical protein [Bacillus cereus]CAH8242886.1 hypothetical protein WJ0W_000095 [Paenibacillus melissococcoides]CAH8703331.1 hypothetical protein WDD9_000093 [Paenibacillus melissococcoides]CAH8706156.1 hypothetical protein HTL2_001177 [Paenibacillus melissococcoides]